MITVHHLNDSRSQKVLWLLEELGAPYTIKHYQRDAVTLSAPPEMKALHPLGKSPTIEDNGQVYVESGAILEYILRHYGNGRLKPAEDSPDYDRYVEWMHYSEGSAMFPILVKVILGYTASRDDGLNGFADYQTDLHLRYLDQTMSDREFLLGDSFTAADIHVCYAIEIANKYVDVSQYPHALAWTKRLHNRPAFGRSIDIGGPYIYSLRD